MVVWVESAAEKPLSRSCEVTREVWFVPVVVVPKVPLVLQQFVTIKEFAAVVVTLTEGAVLVAWAPLVPGLEGLVRVPVRDTAATAHSVATESSNSATRLEPAATPVL